MFNLTKELHNHRFNAEMTYTEFGKLFKPSAAASIVKRWEQGVSIPTEPRLTQLAEILGVTVATLKNEPTTEKDLHKYIGGKKVDFSEIDNKLKIMNQFRPLNKRQVEAINLDKKIEHVWSSNALEGSTISKYETAAILENGATIHGKSMAEHLATHDLSVAYDYMMDMATNQIDLDETTIRDINRLVTYGDAEGRSAAGQYRVVPAYPNLVPDVKYAEPVVIPDLMQALIGWSLKNKSILHPVEYAALIHQKLVSIHPFIDGNGRTSRLAMNFALTSAGYPIINIASDKKNRDIYLETLRETQRSNNPNSFIKLVADYVATELDDRIKLLRNMQQQADSAKDQTRLDKFNNK